jgi:hypothetical protein
MKITKRQLRRIIKEEKAKIIREGQLQGDQWSLEITQDDYNTFADAVSQGHGTIVEWDVERQWDTMFNRKLSPAGLEYLVSNLSANGLIGDDDGDEGY